MQIMSEHTLGSSHVPLRDLVTDEIRRRILTGALPPGDRLVEDRLAEDLGVSRNPVREAIRVLATEGLVEVTPRRGAAVARPRPAHAEELFEVRVHCHESERSSVDGEWQLDQAALHRALQADVEATGLYDYDFFDAYYNDTYPVSVELEYRTRLYEDVYESYEYNSYYLQLRPTMEHTIRELIDQGFITWEEIGKWNEELTVSDEIVEKYGLMPQVIGGADGPTHVYVTG